MYIKQGYKILPLPSRLLLPPSHSHSLLLHFGSFSLYLLYFLLLSFFPPASPTLFSSFHAINLNSIFKLMIYFDVYVSGSWIFSYLMPPFYKLVPFHFPQTSETVFFHLLDKLSEKDESVSIWSTQKPQITPIRQVDETSTS